MRKTYFKKALIVSLGVAIEFLVASPAYAITLRNATDFGYRLCDIFGAMFVVFIAISAIMGLIGAYLYLTSGGDAEKVTKAHKTLIYTVVGIAVALAARGIPSLVSTLFGSGSISVC